MPVCLSGRRKPFYRASDYPIGLISSSGGVKETVDESFDVLFRVADVLFWVLGEVCRLVAAKECSVIWQDVLLVVLAQRIAQLRVWDGKRLLDAMDLLDLLVESLKESVD